MFVICKDLFLKAIPNGGDEGLTVVIDVCDMQRPLFESYSQRDDEYKYAVEGCL